MCTRNVHTYKPRGLCGWCLLGCGYSASVFAVLLIAANLLPYYLGFLPQLSVACQRGEASWAYYYYCYLIITISAVMVYGNLALAIFTAPGYVPADPWRNPPVHDGRVYSENPFEVQQLDRERKLRYCSKCELFKPDNSHHCNVCGRCIYRMDHHCPWINNCVGRDNGKYFLLFLTYIPIGAFHAVGTTIFSSYFHLSHVDWTSDAHFDVTLLFVVSVTMTTAMGVGFGSFAAHFLYMAYRGQTSVSNHIARKTGAGDHAKASAQVQEDHIYDLFGCDRRWWRMVLPFAPVRDDRGLLGQTTPPHHLAEVV